MTWCAPMTAGSSARVRSSNRHGDHMSSEITAQSPAVTTATKRPSQTGLHRSIADGELVHPWTLSEYFASLNTVLRLPSKVRRRAVEAAEQTAGGAAILAVLGRVRIPKGLVMAGAVVAIVMLVIRPLVLSATNEGASSCRSRSASGKQPPANTRVAPSKSARLSWCSRPAPRRVRPPGTRSWVSRRRPVPIRPASP